MAPKGPILDIRKGPKIELLNLTGEEGHLGKLECFPSRKNFFQLKNGRFLTSFRCWADFDPSTHATYDLLGQDNCKAR